MLKDVKRELCVKVCVWGVGGVRRASTSTQNKALVNGGRMHKYLASFFIQTFAQLHNAAHLLVFIRY